MSCTIDKAELKSMQLDALWELYENTRTILRTRIHEQKIAIDRQLELLERSEHTAPVRTAIAASAVDHRKRSRKIRAPYPAVRPQFRNPEHPDETWSGRGNQPRWLVAQLSAGKTIDDFRIEAIRPSNARPCERAPK